ncbi:MAG: cytochrome c3 family protein [bacterium]
MAQISPGELALPHAQLEGIPNCTKCHTLGGGPDANKCLDCHGEIKHRIELAKGYHLIVTVKEKKACFECHSEHNGQNFKLVFWPEGKNNFDHTKTGYSLEAKHLAVKCEDCHQPKYIVDDLRKWNKKVNLNKTFLGLDPNCLSCHQDEHRRQLSKDCLKCHNYAGWKPAVKFDHIKTKFRLMGKHVDLDCVKCHPKISLSNRNLNLGGKLTFVKYVGLQFDNCTPCHREVHQGKFGQYCKKCHDTYGWNRIKADQFNHSLTRFPLMGRHSDVSCEKCHVSRKIKTPRLFANCFDCHKDVHFGQFVDHRDGGRCENCHDVFGFIPAKYDIEEHAKSNYPLKGSHLAVPCVACHFVADQGTPRERRIFEFKDTTCNGCHQDVHKGQFAAYNKKEGCETCHKTSAWNATTFDHNTARFPLLGKHAHVECDQCHKLVEVGTERERILYRPIKMACNDCHEDTHQGQFSVRGFPAKCDKCHLPASWSTLIFDHNNDSLFRITGAHEKVPCADCHKLQRTGTMQFVLYKPIDRRCKNCHGKK